MGPREERILNWAEQHRGRGHAEVRVQARLVLFFEEGGRRAKMGMFSSNEILGHPHTHTQTHATPTVTVKTIQI